MQLSRKDQKFIRLTISVLCAVLSFALLTACSTTSGKNDYLTFDAAFSIPHSDDTSEVYVFCTLHGDEEKNINMAADQAKIQFGPNSYPDQYSLNKSQNDQVIRANTEYSGVTDGSHGTIYAGSDKTEKVAFIFVVGNKDLEGSGDAILSWVNYRVDIPKDQIEQVASNDDILSSLSCATE